MSNIQAIARYLARPIPAPRLKPPKSTLTWRQLKPGQFLTNLQTVHNMATNLNETPGTLWLVEYVNSAGARVVTVSDTPKRHTITNPEWKGVDFDRARKPNRLDPLREIYESLATSSFPTLK